ncbi:MAG: Na/Pi cotransporter family protein [Phycisphaerae bacterium]|nr:Na/Pi cotransporter family protein [Phycisphaerae bacterium]
MLRVLTIAGGVALILFGVRYLRKGLDRLFGQRLGTWMQRLARSRVRAFFTGLGVSVMAPSSTTVSILAVQSVQAGQLTARQMLAVVLGADIGLTLTVQLIALQVEQYAPILVLAGVLLFQFTQGRRSRGIGQVVLAMGFIFLGILTIKQAASGVEPSGDLVKLIEIGTNHPAAMAALAAIMAMALQSSTATIGLLLGLAAAGTIEFPLRLAIAWVVGANVGIVLTMLLIGWGRTESRRLAAGNLVVKGAAAIVVLVCLTWAEDLLARAPGGLTHQIAHAHTGFNLALALVALPLVQVISRLVERLVVEPPSSKRPAFGPRYISVSDRVDSVALALGQSRQEILHMSEIVRRMLSDVWLALKQNDRDLVRRVSERDDQVDLLDAEIKKFLTRVVDLENDPEDAAEQMRQLRYTAELETIGDIIDKNLVELVLKRIHLDLRFSPEGWEELDDFHRKVTQNMSIAETAFTTRDQQLAQQLLRHKQRLDAYAAELRDRHFRRLNEGLSEALETSAIHLDVLTHLKRINSCLTHVAYAVLHEVDAAPVVPEG